MKYTKLKKSQIRSHQQCHQTFSLIAQVFLAPSTSSSLLSLTPPIRSVTLTLVEYEKLRVQDNNFCILMKV